VLDKTSVLSPAIALVKQVAIVGVFVAAKIKIKRFPNFIVNIQHHE
jgi:hypothetical protein